MVVRSLVPILEMAGFRGRVLPLDRGLRGFARAVATLRTAGYRSGVLMSAAFSAAWLFRCGGVRRLRGTRTDGRGFLLSEPVEPAALRGRHRGEAFGLLAGLEPDTAPAPIRLAPPSDRADAWRARLPGSGPLVGLFAGANAPARRWPGEGFAAVAREVLGGGGRAAVLGGASETRLTGEVSAAAPGAVDLGGRTDLLDLAAILSLCDLVVTNDTGPMHLAGAVGTPTVSLWGSSDPEEVRQGGAADVRVEGAALPCRPCRRNHCPRRGRGTILADAHEECMRLIDVEHVVRAVRASLGSEGGR
jgi:heptosyltransferase-2